MVGTNIDAHASQHQSRDMLRDAPIRLGFFAGIVSAAALGITLSLLERGPATYSGWASMLFGAILLIGGSVGYKATQRSKRADAHRTAREAAERKMRKDAELAEFLAAKSKANHDLEQLNPSEKS